MNCRLLAGVHGITAVAASKHPHRGALRSAAFKIAARFGVNPGTVQRISRPFVAPSVAAVIP